jgi:hypothetical protein
MDDKLVYQIAGDAVFGYCLHVLILAICIRTLTTAIAIERSLTNWHALVEGKH